MARQSRVERLLLKAKCKASFSSKHLKSLSKIATSVLRRDGVDAIGRKLPAELPLRIGVILEQRQKSGILLSLKHLLKISVSGPDTSWAHMCRNVEKSQAGRVTLLLIDCNAPSVSLCVNGTIGSTLDGSENSEFERL